MSLIKRFIAGARCPQCHQLDKIRCWREGEYYKSECVSCDYEESLDKNGEKIKPVKIEQVQVVKFPPEN